MLVSKCFIQSKYLNSLKIELAAASNPVKRFHQPTGRRTGLGVNLSYDIIKANGAE